MSKKEAYEQAKARYQAAHRALCIADGQNAPAAKMEELAKKEQEAWATRQRLFAEYMASDE